jgi:hypothetical protein
MSNRFFDALQTRQITGGLPAFMRDVKRRQDERIKEHETTIELRKEEAEGLETQIREHQRVLQRPATPSYREVIMSRIDYNRNQVADILNEIEEAKESIKDTQLLSATELGLAGRTIL